VDTTRRHSPITGLITGGTGLSPRAQNVVEYGLLIVLIVIIVLLGIANFGHMVEPWFAQLAGRITTDG
jgi:Flp pilus assembly pilin Flp